MRQTYHEEAEQFRLLKLGFGGLVGYRTRHSRTEIPDNRTRPYLGDLAEGGVVADLTVMPEDKLLTLSVSGPMVDPELEDGEVLKFERDDLDCIVAQGMTGPLKPLIDLAKESGDKFVGFDYVSIKVWTALYFAAGARIGVRHGNKVVWNHVDGEASIEEIPPEEQRYVNP